MCVPEGWLRLLAGAAAHSGLPVGIPPSIAAARGAAGPHAPGAEQGQAAQTVGA